jgi:hypothetical protein
MTDTTNNCECQGVDYQGCKLLPNKLYACHKKDGTVDNTKACKGELRTGNDGISGWSEGCSQLSYDDLKTRVTKWCTKLYQDGIYDYNQYQDCLQNLDTGTVNYYKRTEDESVDDEKDVKRIYGYYPKGNEKINDYNPNLPVVKDDYTKMTFFHPKENGFLKSGPDGMVDINPNAEIREEMNWQLMEITKENIFAIRSNYGKFLVGTDKNTVEATRDNLTPWGQWKMIKQNDMYAFLSVQHNKYLSYDGNILALKQGWSDNNLWLLKEKEESKGNFFENFDKSGLNLKKDELINELDNKYRNAVDLKFKRDYYKNKISQLKYLRDQQKQSLINHANKTRVNLLNRKKIIIKELQIIKSKINLPKRIQNRQYDYLSKQYQSDCMMPKDCMDFAVEMSQPISADKYDVTRAEKIKNKQAECKWTEDLTYRVLSRNYVQPTAAFCEDLNTQVDSLKMLTNTNRAGYFKLFNEKRKEITNINYNLAKINVFKNDIEVDFKDLNEKEKLELNKVVENVENERLSMLEQFRKAEIDVIDYIKYLADSNRSMENEIKGLSEDIDGKLNQNNKLELDISINSSNAKSDNLQEIIDSNELVVDNQIYYKRNEFMLLITVLIILIVFIGIMSYQTYIKFMD